MASTRVSCLEGSAVGEEAFLQRCGDEPDGGLPVPAHARAARGAREAEHVGVNTIGHLTTKQREGRWTAIESRKHRGSVNDKVDNTDAR